MTIQMETRQAWIEADNREVAERAAKLVALTEREEKALNAYAMGMSYSSIAGLLGVKTASAAQKIVDKALERRARQITQQGVNKARARMMQQIELVLSRYMPLAMTGDDKAAKIVDLYLGRQERILGLAAPKKHEHHHEIDLATVEQRRQTIVASLQAYQARTVEGEVIES